MSSSQSSKLKEKHKSQGEANNGNASDGSKQPHSQRSSATNRHEMALRGPVAVKPAQRIAYVLRPTLFPSRSVSGKQLDQYPKFTEYDLSRFRHFAENYSYAFDKRTEQSGFEEEHFITQPVVLCANQTVMLFGRDDDGEDDNGIVEFHNVADPLDNKDKEEELIQKLGMRSEDSEVNAKKAEEIIARLVSPSTLHLDALSTMSSTSPPNNDDIENADVRGIDWDRKKLEHNRLFRVPMNAEERERRLFVFFYVAFFIHGIFADLSNPRWKSEYWNTEHAVALECWLKYIFRIWRIIHPEIPYIPLNSDFYYNKRTWRVTIHWSDIEDEQLRQAHTKGTWGNGWGTIEIFVGRRLWKRRNGKCVGSLSALLLVQALAHEAIHAIQYLRRTDINRPGRKSSIREENDILQHSGDFLYFARYWNARIPIQIVPFPFYRHDAPATHAWFRAFTHPHFARNPNDPFDDTLPLRYYRPTASMVSVNRKGRAPPNCRFTLWPELRMEMQRIQREMNRRRQN